MKRASSKELLNEVKLNHDSRIQYPCSCREPISVIYIMFERNLTNKILIIYKNFEEFEIHQSLHIQTCRIYRKYINT